MKKEIVVYSVEYGGDVEKTEARYFLLAESRDKFIIQRDKHSFSGVVFSEAGFIINIIIIIIVNFSRGSHLDEQEQFARLASIERIDAQKTSNVYDWPGISNVWQIEQDVEDDQHSNKNKNKTVQGILHSRSDVRI